MGQRQKILYTALTSCVIAANLFVPAAQSQDSSSTGSSTKPFVLGVEEKHKAEDSTYPAYPSYPQPVMVAPPAQPRPPKHLNAGIEHAQQRPVQQPTPPPRKLQASASEVAPPGVLPAQFLGAWNVLGQRGGIEALPQYQAGIENIFTSSNQQTWSITGNPQQGYSLDCGTGVVTQIYVDKVQGNTAYLRYAHPIKNTVAQEAIVMMLAPGGQTFEGLERVSIVKQGEPGPRCKVQYKLFGQRAR